LRPISKLNNNTLDIWIVAQTLYERPSRKRGLPSTDRAILPSRVGLRGPSSPHRALHTPRANVKCPRRTAPPRPGPAVGDSSERKRGTGQNARGVARRGERWPDADATRRDPAGWVTAPHGATAAVSRRCTLCCLVVYARARPWRPASCEGENGPRQNVLALRKEMQADGVVVLVG
jgi:hypothetical protein